MQATLHGFSFPEKLAIVQAIDLVILADGTVHSGEIDAIGHLMYRLDFDSNFILQARNLPAGQGLILLNEMTYEKKQSLAEILDDIAKSDGFIHKKEIAIILSIFNKIGVNHKLK